MKKFLAVCFVVCLTLIALDPTAAANEALRKALTFHASVDQVMDADFALGSKQLYTATLTKTRRRQTRAASSRRSTGPGADVLWGLKFAPKTEGLTTRPGTWLINRDWNGRFG
jgi:hypothetical protein